MIHQLMEVNRVIQSAQEDVLDSAKAIKKAKVRKELVGSISAEMEKLRGWEIKMEKLLEKQVKNKRMIFPEEFRNLQVSWLKQIG